MQTDKLHTLREDWQPLLIVGGVLLTLLLGLAVADAMVNAVPRDWWPRYMLAMPAGMALAGLALVPLRRYRVPLTVTGILLFFLAPFVSGTIQGDYLLVHPNETEKSPYCQTVSKAGKGASTAAGIMVCGAPFEVYLRRKTIAHLNRKRSGTGSQ
jgi:ABC-type uncharacterized transport system permease subunit